jgi:hypothetical protein
VKRPHIYFVVTGLDPVIHDEGPHTLMVRMDHRITLRQTALRAGRRGPVMTSARLAPVPFAQTKNHFGSISVSSFSASSSSCPRLSRASTPFSVDTQQGW